MRLRRGRRARGRPRPVPRLCRLRRRPRLPHVQGRGQRQVTQAPLRRGHGATRDVA